MGRELWEGAQTIYRTISRSQALIAAVLAVGASALLARFALFLAPHIVNCMFWDEWSIPTFPYGEWAHLSWWDLFNWQHNATRLGLGVPLSIAAYRLTNYHQASIFWLLYGLNTLAIVGFLWLRRHVYGAWSYADLTIPILFTAITQFETYLITGNECCHVLPLFLLMLYCAAWLIKRPAWRYGAIVLMNFLTGWSGFGFSTLIFTPVLLSICIWQAKHDRKEQMQAGLALLASLAFIGLYFYHYDMLKQSHAGIPAKAYLAFMTAEAAHPFGLEDFLQRRTYLFGVAVLLLMLASCLWGAVRWARSRKPNYLFVSILTAFSLLFIGTTAWGRTISPITGMTSLATAWGSMPPGVILARSSRYGVELMPGLMGLYLAVVTWQRGLLRSSALLGCFLVSLLSIFPIKDSDVTYINYYQPNRVRWLQTWRNVGDVWKTNQLTKFRIDPREESEHLQGKLEYLRDHQIGPFAP